jgi:DNA-directed RNA polymerase specialized sigma24 family protein
MLETFPEVERALRRYTDAFQPRSTSMLTGIAGGKSGGDRFPFAAALLDELELRKELKSRMSLLTPEENYVLVRWYVEACSAQRIAADLGRSVRHVYRLRTKAIEHIVNLGRADEFADADVAEFA